MTRTLPRGLSPEAGRQAETVTWRPRNCVWELTLACNLRCAHCGSRAGQPRPGELDTQECLDLVDQLAELECELVTLSGGEPTLREDWDLVARAVADRGIPVNMVTNGTGIDRETARRAVDAGMCNVGVSLDGPSSIHDRIRGPGTFRRTVAGIEQFLAVGLGVGIMTTVNRLNFHRLEEIRDIAAELGASSLRLQLGKPMGAMGDRDDLVIRPRQLLDLVPRVARMKKEGVIPVNVGDSIGYYGPHDKTLRGWGWRGREERWQGCQAGMNAIGIESDGGIKGCLSMQARVGEYDPFREGTVRERSLAELWFRPGAFPYNREFSLEDLSGFCRRCSKALKCRGGARCVSSAVTGLLSEDPFCYHRVASLDRQPGLRRAVAQGAAAASAALVLSVSGCGTEGGATGSADSEFGVTMDVPVADNMLPKPDAADPGVNQDPGASGDVIDCSQVCCMCDYGIIPEDLWEACCAPPDEDVIEPTPEPLPEPVEDVKEPDPGIPDEIVQPVDAPDAIDCSQVCCTCEYGIIPDEVWDACCAPPPEDVIDPDPGNHKDVVQPEEVAEPVDCSQVCCMCDYGIIPEDLWEACCAPPPEDVIEPKDVVEEVPPVNCAAMQCFCNDEPVPPAVWKECCAVCASANCCDCDYGMSPPPQCCPDEWSCPDKG